MSNRVSTHWEELHPAIRCAFDGCFDHLGYDISVISKEDQDRLFTATLDALPQGEEAAKKAAAALLVEMATDEGWADCLDTYEHNAEFARFLEIEPRLRGLLHEIACIVPGGECFCANLVWYEQIKPRLAELVGWDATKKELRTSFAYDVATNRLYERMPECRNCNCL